jgi:hypothetical protein
VTELMEISVNLREFACIVTLEKWLGFEDDELVHHVLEFLRVCYGFDLF